MAEIAFVGLLLMGTPVSTRLPEPVLTNREGS